MGFVNRERELEFLNERWEARGAQLVVIWGKRRIGKTELVKQFLKDKPHVYFLAESTSPAEQLRHFSAVLGGYFKDPFLRERGFGDWLQLFDYIKTKKTKFVLAIDEFPFLIQANAAIPSLFQKAWDEYWKDGRLFLILLGSSIGMMEKHVLDYRAPLFGRRTAQWRLEPLSFRDAAKFMPRSSFEEQLKYFSIAGGTPAYWLQFDLKDFWGNVKERILKKGAMLYEEVEFLLREELREPRYYFAILAAIAQGKRRLSEIVNSTGLAVPVANKYLSVLCDLKIAERELPATEAKPLKSKKGLYRIQDQFFNFWFHFVFPHRDELEMDRREHVLRIIKRDFARHLSSLYEDAARDILKGYAKEPFPFMRVGKWWDRNEEIDIVGLNEQENKILFGEAKWSNKAVGEDIYSELKRKAQKVEWGKPGRKEYFCLFSKSGFTANMKGVAAKEKVCLFEKDKPLL